MLSRLAASLIAILFSSAVAAQYAEISVGEVGINLPVPNGYVLVGQELQEVTDILDATVAGNNRRLATIFTQRDHSAMVEGEDALPRRHLGVQVSRRVEGLRVQGTDFAAVKHKTLAQNEEVVRAATAQMPDLFTRSQHELEEKLSSLVRLNRPSLLVLPVHWDSQDAISYSMLIQGDTQEGDDPSAGQSVTTVTLLHVRDKLIFLYAYGSASDLAWTRTASRQWTEAILAANDYL